MRSTLSVLSFVLVSLVLILSCQKELSLENPNATATFTDTSGNCLPITVKGIYQKDSLLTDSSYIEAEVSASGPGNYFIQTVTVNGFYFKGEGRFTDSGLQVIKLMAVGTPVEAGDFDFFIDRAVGSCPFTITVTQSLAGAHYTITDTAGNCPEVTVNGVFMESIPTDTSNTIDFDVHVTGAGSYTIHTDTINGISFTNGGSFTDTGTQHITLQASGLPVTEGDFTFHIRGDTSNCSFTLNVLAEITDPAEYTLDCSTANIEGNYSKGVAMTPENKVTMFANVAKAGKYNITTTQIVNGVSFAASGTFTHAAASVPVVLKAVGTPLTKGSFDYAVNADGNSCAFRVEFTGRAVYNFAGYPGACTTPVVNGIYTKGIALNSTNTVVVKADVIETGAYSFSTNSANGMSFSSAGVFTVTGLQDITLVATGTPIDAGSFSFTPQSANACSFDITVVEPPVTDGVYTCKIDGAFTAFNDRAMASIETLLTPNTLSLDGYTGPANGGNVPELQMFINNNDGSPLQAGTYNEKDFLKYHIQIDYFEVLTDGSVVHWNTSSNFLTNNPPFTITITSITATRVKGTFSGEITNLFQGSTANKKITEGVFDLPIQ